jgi:hypothetical protein
MIILDGTGATEKSLSNEELFHGVLPLGYKWHFYNSPMKPAIEKAGWKVTRDAYHPEVLSGHYCLMWIKFDGVAFTEVLLTSRFKVFIPTDPSLNKYEYFDNYQDALTRASADDLKEMIHICNSHPRKLISLV